VLERSLKRLKKQATATFLGSCLSRDVYGLGFLTKLLLPLEGVLGYEVKLPCFYGQLSVLLG
jgi:hypothetical protein